MSLCIWAAYVQPDAASHLLCSPLQKAVIYLVGNASRIYMQTLNTTTFSGLEHMEAALQRPTGQPLITVSNHVAAMDDPLVVSNVVPPQYLGKPEAMR